jgi:hypothetical protein
MKRLLVGENTNKGSKRLNTPAGANHISIYVFKTNNAGQVTDALEINGLPIPHNP